MGLSSACLWFPPARCVITIEVSIPRLCRGILTDFDYSPCFDIIKYPFLDFHHYADQRLVPWQATTALSGQEKEMYVTADMDLNSLQNET